jgi:energy-coupling factor transport system ATP-binding protein
MPFSLRHFRTVFPFMAIIEMQGVKFTHASGKYSGQSVKALDNITLSIEKGEFVVILGRSGSGKSTLARLLNALYRPDAGRVCIHGIDTRDDSRLWEVRRLTGMVFAETDNQIVGTTVEEDVAFGPENLGLPAAEILCRVDHALQTVGLADLAGHAPHTLTAGEKQRLALAGILTLQPECIILDDATAQLDAAGRQELQELLRRLNREQGITIVQITPHKDEAILADRVFVLDAGKIVLAGTPDEVFADVARIESLGFADKPPVLHHIQDEVDLPEIKKRINLPLLTLGSYSPGCSLLHRADPRSKILLALLFIVILYGVESYPAFFLLGAFTLLTALVGGRSLTNSWRGLRPILWLAGCAAFFNIFIVTGAPVATSGILSYVSWEGLDRSAKMALRLVLLVSGATLLTATTTPLALTAGLESLLHPLKRIKFPVQQLAMLLALALRFIPVIVEEAARMIKSRISPVPPDNNGRLRQRLQNYVLLLFPLFVVIFRRGEALATAMEARCYRVDVERTRMRSLKFSTADLVSNVLMFLLFVSLFLVESTIVWN